MLSECWALDRKDKKKGNGLVTTSGQFLRSQSSETPNTFKPFISRGLLSIDGSNAEMKEIRILHDTGASQSLLAEGVPNSLLQEKQLICDVKLGFSCVPLHRVFL